MPRITNTQRHIKDEAHRQKEIFKIGKAQRIDYITQGEVISLTHVFLVSKGDNEISMVYNDTSRGLNDDFWDPHLSLTTVINNLRYIEEGVFMADRDVKYMFLNLMPEKGSEFIIWSGHNSYEKLRTSVM